MQDPAFDSIVLIIGYMQLKITSTFPADHADQGFYGADGVISSGNVQIKSCSRGAAGIPLRIGFCPIRGRNKNGTGN
jgi:hypothetical protein